MFIIHSFEFRTILLALATQYTNIPLRICIIPIPTPLKMRGAMSPNLSSGTPSKLSMVANALGSPLDST